jgi:hypothetical protein
MNAVAEMRQDVPMSGEDPHGLVARMLALGLQFKDIAERLDVAPNTVTRAMRKQANSDTRPLVDALLAQLEQERESPPPGRERRKAGLDRLIPEGMQLDDVRIEYVGDGKIQRLVALLVDSDLSKAQVEAEIREWRKGHTTDR